MPIEILELIVKAKVGEEERTSAPASENKAVSEAEIDQMELALEQMTEFLKRKKER